MGLRFYYNSNIDTLLYNFWSGIWNWLKYFIRIVIRRYCSVDFGRTNDIGLRCY